MSKEEKIKYDCTIAYFMGWRIDNSYPDKGRVWRKGNAIEMDSTLKFSTDWGLLMEVCESINKIEGYEVIIRNSQCLIYYNGSIKYNVFSEDGNKEALYQCLYRFIEEYIKQ